MSSVSTDRIYIAIDLKSFYASVECIERGLNPLTTNLVVADESRTEKTICLAVTPALKAFGISGRARLFEVVQKVGDVNARRRTVCGGSFSGVSCDADELAGNPSLELSYIAAPPRMSLYMEYSSRIYETYLKYVSHEDIHVYSIDEVFIDVTQYLKFYNMTAKELCMTMIKDVLAETGITATGGIGTNMYLCKVAMDIVAKHIPADKNGVRIAELDERSYREKLWSHEPITDFWRVGSGTAKTLYKHGLYTMGDVARCSLGKDNEYYNEELLYKLFGVNAELLIDHAWGWECAIISQIKAYRPENNSISSGQVLHCPYSYDKGRLIVQEMTDLLVLDLVAKRLLTDQIVLTVGYDIENLVNPEIRKLYTGPVVTDHYGRKVPKAAHGSINLGTYSSSTKLIMEKVLALYSEIVNEKLTVRRLTIAAEHVKPEDVISKQTQESYEQMDLFTDYEEEEKRRRRELEKLKQERKIQEAMLSIKTRYGKNAVLKGFNFEEGATTIDRNAQVGGHRA